MNEKEFLKKLAEYERTNPSIVNSQIEIIKEIRDKYNVGADDAVLIIAMTQIMGFGRNHDTAQLLRAVADMIDSGIAMRESLEAKFENKLQ